MIRYFLVLAVTGTSLLAADFVLGLLAAGTAPGPGATARGIHLLFSLVTVVALLGVHSIVYTYFVATGKWAREVVTVYGLPDWFTTHAIKNKRRAFRFVMGSMTAIAIAAWLGAAADTLGGAYSLWHLGLAALAVGFNVGSFFVEYSLVVAHVRLLHELKGQADRMREARYELPNPDSGELEQPSPSLGSDSSAPLG
jgi:hypothetical protein